LRLAADERVGLWTAFQDFNCFRNECSEVIDLADIALGYPANPASESHGRCSLLMQAGARSVSQPPTPTEAVPLPVMRLNVRQALGFPELE